MGWKIELHRSFRTEVKVLSAEVRQALGDVLAIIEDRGPDLGRPKVDTLNGSRYPNMKELRFDADGGIWRFAFAFDVERQAVVLVGGNKQGENQKRFYEWLIRTADERFDDYPRKEGR